MGITLSTYIKAFIFKHFVNVECYKNKNNCHKHLINKTLKERLLNKKYFQ